ncbi:MAG: hypothetical protein IK083_05675 [Abditibacteriota bacterium]|nr:hypothetical protein [Abditibacteriota bacterium]
MVHKNAADAGADQRTPSVPQYFSWINSTNEGSCEQQTLVNLAFFEWLKKTYGMQIGIYAWDAGNFDGAGMGYGDPEGAKFRRQYPRGYAPIAEKAASLGIRMGLWGSPDGFGDTPEAEKKRYDFMTDLCRRWHFALFKVDGVCGGLRPEKAPVYARMLRECRKYSPDLIVLNHRLDLYEAEKYVTTFLWQGAETYVDVFSGNERTCMHHRGFIFDRGLPIDDSEPPQLERLAEDHGVCISSSVAYFEDDLIYQAFGRCMILAPEIYGNPWFMRDDEYPRLARVFNLHRRYAPILVDGMILPASCGPNAVSRGSATHRFVTTGNNTWSLQEIGLGLDGRTGIAPTDAELVLVQRHPTEKLIGRYAWGDTARVTLMPHRAHLFEISAAAEADPFLDNCEYETLREDERGLPLEVRVVCTPGGSVRVWDKGLAEPYMTAGPADRREFAPVMLGTSRPAPGELRRREQLYEAAQFGIDNDSLESRELRRSGPTSVPQVRAAREAFFAQATYRARGCEGAWAFDGRPDTFFDAQSQTLCGGLRIRGGCLRVDLGGVMDADALEIVCFETASPTAEVAEQIYTPVGSSSADLLRWTDTGAVEKTVLRRSFSAPVVRFSIHDIYQAEGRLVSARYPLGDSRLRYFRLPCPMDRIYAIRVLKDGREAAPLRPRVNNLQAPFEPDTVGACLSCAVTLPEVKDGDYISAAIEGEHGAEDAWCVAELEGRLLSFPDRAPAYRSNVWEHIVMTRDRNYTCYLPLSRDMSGKELRVYTLLRDPERRDVRCDLYLCPRH